jgi:hypothetical protein
VADPCDERSSEGGSRSSGTIAARVAQPQLGTEPLNPATREATVGLVQKVKRAFGRRRPKGESGASEKSRDKRSASTDESLPGGASGREAAEAPPQRAAELAD